jgi:DNA polymerase-3 subunit epsilon
MSDHQLSLDEAGTPLASATFVVVDLETTGGSSRECAITEIGAVKVRGGEVLGEFTTLVNPGIPIPPFIAALTGITNADVVGAPSVLTAVAMFLEFAGDAAVVAHNAPFDLGFLRAACERHDLTWNHGPVVDTARLARSALQRDEVRNCKLRTLAAYFRTTTEPSHRALADARATAEVFHHLLERVGNFGVMTLEDLRAFTGRVSTAQRTKRHLADHLPTGPGVYIFEDREGRPLYIGTSKNIRQRVRSYFTAAEQRRRMSEMITIAHTVRAIECATTLEARVRERRLIVDEQPRYNRRSRRASSPSWVKLTTDNAPRLSVVTRIADDGATYLGPFTSHAVARLAAEALEYTYPIRTCTPRLARSPRSTIAGCALGELGRCLAPCRAGHDADAYATTVDSVRQAMLGDVAGVEESISARMRELALAERYEEATRWRERLTNFLSATLRRQRLALIASEPEIVAAVPEGEGWAIHVIRHGFLAAAGFVGPGDDAYGAVEVLRSTAASVTPGAAPAPAGTAEEALDLLHWLESDGIRLVSCTRTWALPVNGGGAWLARFGDARESLRTLETDPAPRPWGPRPDAVTRIRASA